MSKLDDAFDNYIETVQIGIEGIKKGADNLVGLILAAVTFPLWCLGKLIRSLPDE